MTITLELSGEMEAQVRASAARGDREALRRFLAEALVPVAEALVREAEPELTNAEFELLADELANEAAARAGAKLPSLSDYAVSRAGIYADHP